MSLNFQHFLLWIADAPAVTIRYMNGTIKCDCNGVPPICSVHRLDRVSKYEEIVRSVHLDKGTFIFKIDQFPYQRNGRYLCVVSNGIQGTNGMVLQNSSIHVNYEGRNWLKTSLLASFVWDLPSPEKPWQKHFKVRDVKTLDMQCKSYGEIGITEKKCPKGATYFRVLEPKFRFNFLISFSPLVSKH